MIYYKKKTKRYNVEILPDINDEEYNINMSKEVDITFLIDATTSMGKMGIEIKAWKWLFYPDFLWIKRKYRDYYFQFWVASYRYKIDCK